jgi:uncharacterized protein YcnI
MEDMLHIRFLAAISAVMLSIGLLAVAVPVAAHVTANPGEAKAGSYFKADFRVPHGCDGSATVALRIEIPEGVTSVKPQQKPGWELRTKVGPLAKPYESHGKMITEGVTEVEWYGGKLPDDRYEDFGISMKLPDTPGKTVYFPAIQVCEQGETAWIEIPKDGEAQPDHPAPAIKLSAAAGGDGHSATPAATTGSSASDGKDGNGLAVAGLVLGVLGIMAGGGALATVLRRK